MRHEWSKNSKQSIRVATQTHPNPSNPSTYKLAYIYIYLHTYTNIYIYTPLYEHVFLFYVNMNLLRVYGLNSRSWPKASRPRNPSWAAPSALLCSSATASHAPCRSRSWPRAKRVLWRLSFIFCVGCKKKGFPNGWVPQNGLLIMENPSISGWFGIPLF